MTAHSPSAALLFLILVPGVALLPAGCDRLAAPPAEHEPEPAVRAAPPPADVTPVVQRTGQQIIDEFLATLPSHRTDDQLRELSTLEEGLHRITELDVRESSVSDEGASVLPAFSAVTRLDLSGSRVTAGVIQYLAGMPWLEELLLGDLPVDDEAVAALSELPALRLLSLSGTAVTEDCFLALAGFESLESLALDNNELLFGNGFSEMLRRGEFKALRELSVNRTGFGYRGFGELNRLRHLERLSAVHTDLMDPELDGIQSCTRLRFLNLNDNRLTDAGLRRLTRLRELEELHVSGCRGISDAGLQYLRRHEQLRRLSLEGTSCSLAGASALKERYLENTTILIADQEL